MAAWRKKMSSKRAAQSLQLETGIAGECEVEDGKLDPSCIYNRRPRRLTSGWHCRWSRSQICDIAWYPSIIDLLRLCKHGNQVLLVLPWIGAFWTFHLDSTVPHPVCFQAKCRERVRHAWAIGPADLRIVLDRCKFIALDLILAGFTGAATYVRMASLNLAPLQDCMSRLRVDTRLVAKMLSSRDLRIASFRSSVCTKASHFCGIWRFTRNMNCLQLTGLIVSLPRMLWNGSSTTLRTQGLCSRATVLRHAYKMCTRRLVYDKLCMG